MNNSQSYECSGLPSHRHMYRLAQKWNGSPFKFSENQNGVFQYQNSKNFLKNLYQPSI